MSTRREITPDQRRAMDFIRAYRRQMGYLPTIAQIATGLQLPIRKTHAITLDICARELMTPAELGHPPASMSDDPHTSELLEAGNMMAEFCNLMAGGNIEHDILIRAWAGELRNRWHIALEGYRCKP